MNAGRSWHAVKLNSPRHHGDRSPSDFLRRAAAAGLTPGSWNVVLWLVSASAFVVALAMTIALSDSQVYGWEIDFMRWARDVDYPEWLFKLTADRLTNADTLVGAVIISSIAVGLWLFRLHVEALLVIVSVPLHALGNLPKLLIERQRPSELIDSMTGFGGFNSLPSGHAEYAITLYGFLLYVAFTQVRNAYARASLAVAWLALVLAVGFARIEAGKHWPLDVIAGYVIGVGLLAVLIWLHRALTSALRDQP